MPCGIKYILLFAVLTTLLGCREREGGGVQDLENQLDNPSSILYVLVPGDGELVGHPSHAMRYHIASGTATFFFAARSSNTQDSNDFFYWNKTTDAHSMTQRTVLNAVDQIRSANRTCDYANIPSVGGYELVKVTRDESTWCHMESAPSLMMSAFRDHVIEVSSECLRDPEQWNRVEVSEALGEIGELWN